MELCCADPLKALPIYICFCLNVDCNTLYKTHHIWHREKSVNVGLKP